MGYQEAYTPDQIRERNRQALANRREYEDWRSAQRVTAESHKPSDWQYGEKTKPTRLPKPEPKPKDVSGLTKRQRKRRAQLARRNAARKAESQALYEGIAALADTISSQREFAAKTDSEASVLRQRRLRRESKRRNS